MKHKYTVEYYHPRLYEWITLCNADTEEEAQRQKDDYEQMWNDSKARVVPYRGKK